MKPGDRAEAGAPAHGGDGRPSAREKLPWLRAALACFLLTWGAAGLAQTIPPGADPGALQQRRIEEQQRRLQEEQLRRPRVEEDLVDDDAYAPRGVPLIEEGVFFRVVDFEFTPSEILAPGELEALAAPYRGDAVSVHRLHELVARINALYRAKGVVTAQAVLPPQDLTDGIVRIRLIEGRVGAIDVRDNRSTDEDYVRARVRQQPGDLVDLAGLERDLQRFNRTNDAQARAELRPGSRVGETDIGILLQEPPRHELTLFSDNAGSEETGEWRYGITYRNRSLFGLRDDLGVSVVAAEGQESYSIGYGTPINTLGTRVRVAYYNDRTKVKSGPFAALGLNGEASAWVATLRHPALIGDGIQVDVLAGAKRRSSRNRFETIVLQNTDTEDVSLGVEVQSSDATGFWLAGLTAAKAHSESLDGSSDRFGIWRASVRRSQTIADGYAAIVALNGQYTSDVLLPASEQWLLGGEYSVRGYSTGLLSGDRGFTASAELHHPIGGIDLVDARLSGFFFVDYGRVRIFRPPGDPRDTTEELMSAGWGVNASLPRGAAARLVYASAQRHRPEEEHNYRILFQVLWSFSSDRLVRRPPPLAGG